MNTWLPDSFFRIYFRLKTIKDKLEFLVILSWLLFFPDKEAHLYFTGAAILICFFALRNIIFMKTIGFSYYPYFLAAFNFLLILLTFFANYHFKAILLLSDILMVSGYFILYYYRRDPHQEQTLFHLIAYIISVFSLLNVTRHIFPLLPKDFLLFISTIHEGVLSGIGALIVLYFILKKWNTLLFTLLLINIAGVYVSRSKAAFAGTLIFVIVLLLTALFRRIPNEKRRFYLAVVISILLLVLILTFTIPNPIKTSFSYSLEYDPYALNRIDIWEMSLTIFTDHLYTGVGLDNFSEVSGQYNFKQTQGPANYFKVAHQTHNDFLKIMTETGLAGLLVILALLCLLARKLFTTPVSEYKLSLVLLLYLLFQAFFFNILFNGFFFFIFLFLVKDLMEEKVVFGSFYDRYKLLLGGMLLMVLVFCYLFPWWSSSLITSSTASPSTDGKIAKLEKAQYLNPLDQNVYLARGAALFNQFQNSANIDAFFEARQQLHRAQQLNPYYIDAYLLEYNLYKELINKKINYPALAREIIAPLEQAEIYAPVNPFIKLSKAQVYMVFMLTENAKQEALKALALEPEFVAALYFLQRNFNHFPDISAFKLKIENIRQKAVKLKYGPGHYLFRLWQVPVKHVNQ